MAFLGSKACHEECGVRIMQYLEGEKGERVLGFDCISLGKPDDARGRWAAMMDSTRILAGNNTDWGSKRCVTYHHFVISPDPRDGVDLETLQSLTLEWAEEFFGTDMDPGRLGQYEVAIVYHDDNERGIPHAHVIVNNTNFVNGRRLQISNKDNKMLTDRLQDMCEARGLSFFDEENAQEHLKTEGRYFTKAERKLIKDGAFSWKQDIANNVAIAKRLAANEDEFVATCERIGIGVKLREDGDFNYIHYKNPERWKVSGYRLGRNYTRESIIARAEDNAKRYGESIAKVRENVCRHVLEDLAEDMEMVAVVSHAESVRDVAFTLSVNDRYNICSDVDYELHIASLRAQLASTQTEKMVQKVKARLGELAKAREVAGRGRFFEGAQLHDAHLVRVPLGTSSAHSSGGGQSGGTRSRGDVEQRREITRPAGRGGATQQHGRAR